MTNEPDYKIEVLKVYPDATLEYMIDLHCDTYFYIMSGSEIISDTVIHNSFPSWKSAYERIKNQQK